MITTAHHTLAAALLAAVQAQDFPATADAWQQGAPLGVMPSIDLAVVAFAPPGTASPPVWANVLFSREHPAGVIARISADAGPVANIRFDADQRNAARESVLWRPGADWSRFTFTPLWPAPGRLADETGARIRFVAPYPASLIKLMVAVGVGLALDRGLIDAWPDALAPMMTVSDNDATDACVSLLHRAGLLDGSAASLLNRSFAAHGLPTLRMLGTTRTGGWRNADGAGVGMLHMTAWDTVRLLWLLDADAPPAPWLPPGHPPLLKPATRDHLRAVLAAQTLDEVLSSGKHRGLPGWVPGLPDAPRFAHKTGTTDNYGSDAGIVAPDADGRGHLIVALLSTLGLRYAPHENAATTWRVPALGAAVWATDQHLNR